VIDPRVKYLVIKNDLSQLADLEKGALQI